MVNTDWLSKPRGITKIVGLVLTIIILALSIQYDISHGMDGWYFMHIIPAAYFFLYVNYLLGYILDASLGKAPMKELVMNAVGLIFFVTCAGLAFDAKAKAVFILKSRSDAFITYGVFCLLMVVVNVADGFFNFQNRGSS